MNLFQARVSLTASNWSSPRMNSQFLSAFFYCSYIFLIDWIQLIVDTSNSRSGQNRKGTLTVNELIIEYGRFGIECVSGSLHHPGRGLIGSYGIDVNASVDVGVRYFVIWLEELEEEARLTVLSKPKRSHLYLCQVSLGQKIKMNFIRIRIY